jgi:hypothetical protein
MKYIRKTPVEAIQWNGHNLNEVSEFISRATKSYSMWNDDFGNLDITYSFQKGRVSQAVVPLFGWVVRDGKAFEFYKDATFRKTFDEVQEDGSKGIDWEGMDKTIREAFDGFDEVVKGFKDVFGAAPIKEASDDAIRTRILINPDGRLTKLIDDLYKDDEKTRKEIKKNLSEGLKEMAGSDTNKATFESVLDEMKELHAKKDKDYGSAFHKSFEEFGATAGVVRLNDKMERVKSLVKNGKAEVKDESLLDSLKDAACYAVMLYVELKNKDNG